MATDAVMPATLLEQADAARGAGQGARAAALYTAAADRAGRDGDLDAQVTAVLGLARCQEYNVTPGALPVRLYEPYAQTADPVQRARLAAALARCWAYSGEPRRARPFADEALRAAEAQDAPVLLADALDAALTAYWGPDGLDQRRSWALRLGDVAAHLPDLDARLQAHLWALTLAWEVLDLARMHREARALELLAVESPRAAFFAASRRLALDLLRGRTDTLPVLHAAAVAAGSATLIPDSFGVLHNMTGYTALVAGDRAACAAEAVVFEEYAVSQRRLAAPRPAVTCDGTAGYRTNARRCSPNSAPGPDWAADPVPPAPLWNAHGSRSARRSSRPSPASPKPIRGWAGICGTASAPAPSADTRPIPTTRSPGSSTRQPGAPSIAWEAPARPSCPRAGGRSSIRRPRTGRSS